MPKDSGFSAVNTAAISRTGYDLSWTRHAADDEAALDASRGLLASDLTLDNAVRVALLNNRQLQATFEDLGIARGQLIQAGLIANPVFGFDGWLYDNALTFEGLLSEDLTSILY